MLKLTVGAAESGMGWMEFVASLVASLAWPVAAVLIALAFRKQIAGLLNKIRRLSLGDAAVELGDQLDKAEASLQQIPEAGDGPPQPLPSDRFQRLLEISPSAAILDAWKGVEIKLRDVAKMRGHSSRNGIPSFAAAKLLHEDGAISDAVYTMLRDLQRIRNMAAHSNDALPTDAFRFYELAETVTKALDTSYNQSVASF